MATTVLSNSFISGAMGGLLANRFSAGTSATIPTATDYTAVANAAAAIGAECITMNALLAVPMADADNANIGTLAAAVAKASIEGDGYVSTTAADYLPIAKQIVAATKAAVSKLA